MKRAFLIPLIVLLLVNMACSLTGTKPTDAPEEPTKAVVSPKKATQPPAPPAVEATDTEAAPAEADPTDVPETDEPAPAEPKEFKDTFDDDTGNWSDVHVVTTQAPGRAPFMKVTTGSGFMRIALQDKETYVYRYVTQDLAGATTFEIDFQNKGAINGGIAMVCKANEDRTSWYEVRVSAANNFYNFYEYSKKRKDEEGKNPYILLSKGAMKIDQYYPTKPNHILFTCSDSELSIDVNKGKLAASFALENPLDGNTFGVGVMSADTLPGTFDIDTVVIK